MMSYRRTEIYVAQLVTTLQALDIMLQLFIILFVRQITYILTSAVHGP